MSALLATIAASEPRNVIEMLSRLANAAKVGLSATTPCGILSMAVDSGTNIHIIAGKDFGYVKDVRTLAEPIHLETANGAPVLTKVGNVNLAGIKLVDCLLDPQATSSLCAPGCLERHGWEYIQGGGRALLKSPDVTIFLEARDGLYWLNDQCAKSYSGPPKAYSVEATKLVTIATEDGEVLCEIPNTATSRIPNRLTTR